MNQATGIKTRARNGLSALALYLPLAASQATELVYTPVNPNFGGSPLNGSTLLNSAQAQNNTKDPATAVAKQGAQQSALDQFNDMLERAVLTRLATAAVGNVVSDKGELIPGVVHTENFTIEIIDLGGGVMRMVTTDTVTGATTSIDLK